MDFLNSKHLTSQDGYIHPFRQTGTFSYSALVSDLNGAAESGIIIVSGTSAPEGEGEQHDVVLHWDTAGRQYVPDEADKRKQIKPNDFVVFQFDLAVPGQPPGFILIQGDGRTVGDSRRLERHEAFTHFFLEAGDYSYMVGKGAYRLSVTDHREFSVDDHYERAQEPFVIMVKGDDLSVKQGKIVTGQTVIWAIESGENVSIEGV